MAARDRLVAAMVLCLVAGCASGTTYDARRDATLERCGQETSVDPTIVTAVVRLTNHGTERADYQVTVAFSVASNPPVTVIGHSDGPVETTGNSFAYVQGPALAGSTAPKCEITAVDRTPAK